MSARHLASRLTSLVAQLQVIEESVAFVPARNGEMPWYPRGRIDGKGQPDTARKLSRWIVRCRAALLSGGRSYKGYRLSLDALLLRYLGIRPEDLPYAVNADKLEETMWATNKLLQGLRFLLDTMLAEARQAAKSERPQAGRGDPFWSKDYAAKLLGVKAKTLINMVSRERHRKGTDFPWVARAGRRKDFLVIPDKFVEWMKVGRRSPGRPRLSVTP